MNWANADSHPKIISWAIIDDIEVEGDQTIIITFSNPNNGANIGTQSTIIMTIVDDETPGIFQFSKEGIEVTEGSGTIQLAVERSGGAIAV